MKKMCILYYSDYKSWPAGGMLQYLNNIIPKLDQKYDLTLYGCSIDGIFNSTVNIGEKTYLLKKMGNIKTKKKLIPNYFRYLFETYRYAKTIELEGYDIIYIHSAPIFYAYQKRIKNSKSLLVYHQHGLSENKKFFTYFQDFSMKKANLTLINADLLSIENKQRKLKVVNSFIQATGQVDISKFLPTANKKILKEKLGLNFKYIFIYTGRITLWKDPILLVESFKVFYQKFTQDCCLLLIGDGDMVQEVNQRIKDLSLQNHIFITGFLPHQEIIQYLQVSDIFIMPSKGEGMSLSVVEGMACGLPIIGFDVVGMRELINSDFNGYLLTKRDEHMVAETIDRVLKNQYRLSKNALQFSKKFSNEAVSQKIINAIDNKISNLL